jgi:hypothetical protein
MTRAAAESGSPFSQDFPPVFCTKTIFDVADDEVLRALAKATLKSFGYWVRQPYTVRESCYIKDEAKDIG